MVSAQPQLALYRFYPSIGLKSRAAAAALIRFFLSAIKLTQNETMLGLLFAIFVASPLSFDDAAARAVQNAPDVRVALAQLGVADQQISVAGMLQNPQLSVGSNRNSGYLYGTLVVPIPLFGQRGMAVDAARAMRDVAARGVEVTANDVRLGSRLAWTDLWQAEKELATFSETWERRLRILNMTKARRDDGVASDLEVLRTETEVARADANRRVAEALVEQMASQLCV